MSASDHNVETLTLSLRECRLVCERILHYMKVCGGMVPSARDAVVLSQYLNAGGFYALNEVSKRFVWDKLLPIEIRQVGDDLQLDGQGQHAWLLAEAIADIACDEHRRENRSNLVLFNVEHPEELCVINGFLSRYALACTIGPFDASSLVLTVEPSYNAVNILQDIRVNGLSYPAELWWEVYNRSSLALEPESAISRSHAGPLALKSESNNPELEEDTDLSFLQLKSGVSVPGNKSEHVK